MILLTLAVWTGVIAAENPLGVDYALAQHNGAWIRHPVLGDLSHDAFTHAPNNPIVRGTSPYEWPVNGFLFEDPVSKHWFLYVGEYCRGYAMKPGLPSRCVIFRSHDRGQTWAQAGPVFTEPFTFSGETSPTTHAPDVSVVYHDGRYHLCFDWATESTTWANAANPPPDANSGVGYACSDRPEGPFQPYLTPIASTRNQQPLLGKYRRLYASTIIRRANDWLVLTLTDSGPHFGWALLGMTASHPEGPYSTPTLLLHPQSTHYHPPLLEFFPAFAYQEFLYAPATSVALNRNFQALFRAPIEQAMDPNAWELAQEGSLWHARPAEHEAHGIWGQTFSGFVDENALFHVMFPSRDTAGNGTINLAARPWNQPMRHCGAVLSGHEGPSLACLRQAGPLHRIQSAFTIHGTAAVLWDFQAPLGAEKARSGATLHPLSLRHHNALELSKTQWRLKTTNPQGTETFLSEGPLKASPKHSLDLAWDDTQTATLALDGNPAFHGVLPNGPGLFALWCGQQSHLEITQLIVLGTATPGNAVYLYTDALLGAAQTMEDWEIQNTPLFRYGEGACAKRAGIEAKWNINASRYALWAPQSPLFGKAALYVDGHLKTTLDFSANADQTSAPRFQEELASGRHAIVLRCLTPGVPIDALEVTF